MRRFFAKLAAVLTGPGPARRARPSRPALEVLEDRTVPTVTFHGGAVLPNVRVQALFLGSQWLNDPTLRAQAQYLSGALGSIVNSSYMDALTNAGYGVGRGSVAPSMVDPDPGSDYYGDSGALHGRSTEFRSKLEKVLTYDIAHGGLPGPSANTLYVCFVNPDDSRGGTYSSSLWGQPLPPHGSFQLRVPDRITAGSIPPVRYALINYPVGNTGAPFLSTLDSLTKTLSQEIADAVTDPDLGYYDRAYPNASRARSWYDDGAHAPDTGEIGDIVKDRVMYVNGYAMQRLVNQHDFVMTPAQAAPNRAVNFVLQPNGTLIEVPRDGHSTILAAGIATLSDQGIDNQGHAMVDVVTTDGRAFEIHDTGGTAAFISLGGGVKSAKAGQGVSYLLYNNGDVFEYDDATATSHRVCGSATQIDAGTDAQGVNAVDVIFPGRPVTTTAPGAWTIGIFFSQNAYQYSDDSGAHFIGSGVKSISAGRQGLSAYVTTGGEAWTYSQLSNRYTYWGSGVSQATAGTDENGNWMIDLLLTNGVLREVGASRSMYSVADGVKNMSKARLGAVDVVMTTPLTVKMATPNAVGLGGGIVASSPPGAYEHTLSGWRLLSNNAVAAV
jgi:hypothetical protein